MIALAIQDILGSPDTLVLLLALIVFITIGYKVLSVLKHSIIVAILSAAFPFVLNRFFGTALATTLNAELTYIVSGIGLYLLYEVLVVGLQLGTIIWAVLKLMAKPFVWIYEWITGALGKKKKGNSGEEKNSSQD